MKTLIKFIHCVNLVIKKKIFKERIADKNQVCEKLFEYKQNGELENELEEVINNYCSTTRWQTI